MLTFVVVACIVVGLLLYAIMRKDGAAKTKTLTSGELIIKTYDGQYFYAVDENSVPVLMSKEEGKRLWNLED